MKPVLVAIFSLAFAFLSFADEGMWLFNQPPTKLLRERYHFDATKDWLDHLQKSSVRFDSGGSGSFVSEDGLIITNQHIAADALQKLSDSQTNYLADGFRARTPVEEMKCLDLELNVLDSIDDVTARVNAAVPKNSDPDAAFAARRKVIAEIEKESLDQTGLRSNVITLWKGASYQLYRFKRYTDVRLVFAPEQQLAFFGGDPDNFEFPREDLDISIFRAYENGKPAKVKNFLRFSPKGAREGDLVFVSGHPGHTSRLLTVAELESLRSPQNIPFRLDLVKRKEVLLLSWSARSEENARRARDELFGIQNRRKAMDGKLAGLLDPQVLAAKSAAETDFQAHLAKSPAQADALSAYAKIATATHLIDEQAIRRDLFDYGVAFDCDSFDIARALLRAGDERPKPNGERLEEFADSEKASFELELFSPRPLYADFEILRLADALTFMTAQLGVNDPTVQKVLAGKSPRDRAAELINGTKVRDVAFRKKLYDGGAKAVTAANDPMIELARLVDAESRALRKVDEAQGEVKEQAHAAIDRARIALLGTSGYPDATFTLRLSFGTVKGYEEDGHAVPPITTIGMLYAKAAAMKDRFPFNLPVRWKERESALDPATPLNFVSTNDIIGGNSGSPVVNRNAEFVGIIFDGNLQSLSWDFAFDDRQARAVSVHSAAILAALEKVYEMKGLARELLEGKLPK
jgi:hypothetical protein